MLSNFFQIFLLISPVFLLIILGNFLRRIKIPDVSFWEVNDKLCYWVLVPALLFHYISQVNLSSEMLLSYAAVIWLGIIILIAIVIIVSKILGQTPETWTSVLQGSVRLNAFIGLAIAGSIFGDEGLTIASLFMLVYVPFINLVVIIIMVTNHDQIGKENKNKSIKNIFLEVIKNPFIAALILGLVFSYFDTINLSVITETTGLLGSATLPIMLLTIGAKIQVRDLVLTIKPIAISNFLKLALFPIIAFFVSQFMGLSHTEIIISVIFTSVPTAVVSQTIAKQFQADDQLMTGILTTQVILSFLTIPIILAIIS
jgi:malonate transporter and related proteins